jgi:hypothetical protein
MKKRFAIFSLYLLLFPFCFLYAQPYVDPMQIRYTYGFRNNSAAATPFTHLWAGSDLPIKLRNRTYQLFSPYYEQWNIDSAGTNNIVPEVRSLAFPVGFILSFKDTLWGLNLLPVVRWNGEELFAGKTFQFGGAVFATRQIKPGKKLRFGVYMNSEFFGLFVMQLLGADWRIDEKNYVFGLLPGRLTWEHKVSGKLYYGVTFRALTNSYRLKDGQYLRIDDNQVSMFLDYYPAKRLCVTLEPGYGLMRRLRTGTEQREYTQIRNFGDGPFIKLSTSYRIRF